MRSFIRTALLLACCTSSWPTGLQGQGTAGSEVLFRPVNYDALSTYPSVCFESAWSDPSGRLMITTCSPEATDGMHMFYFDGYEFRAIRHPLDNLPADSRILGRAEDHAVVGRSGSNTLFTANLLTGEIRSVSLPDDTRLPAVHAFSEDSILVAALTTNAILLTTWTSGGLSSSFIEYPGYGESTQVLLWLSHTDVWCVYPRDKAVYQINLLTRNVTPYMLEPEVLQRVQGRALHFDPFWIDGRPVLRTRVEGHYVFLVPDERRQLLVRMDGFEGKVEDCGIFQDPKGNILTYARYADHSYRAILRLKDGMEVDISSVFSGYDHVTVQRIAGEDFTRALHVCHSRGLRTYLLGDSRVVQRTLGGHSIRAMVEVESDQVLVTTQFSERFIVDVGRGGAFEPMDLACALGQRKLISLDDGLFAGVSPKGLVSFNAGRRECQSLVTEIGGVQLAVRYNGRIAMINDEGRLFEFDLGTRRVRPIGTGSHSLQFPPRVYDMLYSAGYLWIATTHGLWKVDPVSGTSVVMGQEPPFTDYHFLCICAGTDGRLWLGTALNGLQVYDPATGHVDVLNTRRGLPSNTVVTVQEDLAGNYWVATHKGVAVVDKAGRLVRVLDKHDGLADEESNRYAGLRTSSGKILVGSINGLSIIDPVGTERLKANHAAPVIYLTDIDYRQDARLDVHLDRFDELDEPGQILLPAHSRSLRVRFALSDFSQAGQANFEWRYAGQEQWRSLGNAHLLELDDIHPGKHEIQVRGYDRAGVPTSNMIRLDVRVRRFFYQAWWFYVLCGLVVAGLIVAWITRLRYAVSQATATIKADKKIIEDQAIRLRKLDEAKSKYFTEISHELRTPLTIISGMAAQILDEPEKWTRKGATLIRNNSQRLLKLVNQILDLRKLESSEVEFRMVLGNIVAYLSYLADTFSDYTRSREIDFSFVPMQDEILMDYDPDRIADIVSNLVSNAIKYCQPGDHVKVEVEAKQGRDGDFCEIRVFDTGAGIPEDQLPHIFDRFYRVAPADSSVEGSGIGLALVHELVQRLQGRIEVRSKLHEESIFTVILPVTRNSTIGHDVQLSEESYSTVQDAQPAASHDPDPGVSVLVVEDKPDLVEYMQAILEGRYTVHVAKDGHMGEEMAYDLVPDLVISDIMMPGQTGLELCARLKGDRRTDHIPIILLTARTDRDTRLESLQKGADAFLTKPFDRHELLMVMANLLEQRRQLQAKYTGVPAMADMGEDAPLDSFIAELDKAIEDRMGDDTFTVVHLCRAMSMSRTNLHNKIKAMTGRSTTGYIRYRRLVLARKLLQEGQLNVSQVAYEVGFQSQSYFSTSYAREFGEPPSETS